MCVCVCMYVCMYVYMYIYIYIYIYTYIHIVFHYMMLYYTETEAMSKPNDDGLVFETSEVPRHGHFHTLDECLWPEPLFERRLCCSFV